MVSAGLLGSSGGYSGGGALVGIFGAAWSSSGSATGSAAVALWALVRQGTLEPGAPLTKRRASPLSQARTDEDGGTSQRREVRPALVLLGQFTDQGHRPAFRDTPALVDPAAFWSRCYQKRWRRPNAIACPQHPGHCHSKPGPLDRVQPSSMTGKPDPPSDIPASSRGARRAEEDAERSRPASVRHVRGRRNSLRPPSHRPGAGLAGHPRASSRARPEFPVEVP